MSFNKISAYLEFFFVILASLIIFYYFPLFAIFLLFFYSLFRNTYYLLASFTFFYDLIFANLLWGIPKLSITILCLIVFIQLIMKTFFINLRTKRKIEYDF